MGRIAALYVLIFTLFRGKNARERRMELHNLYSSRNIIRVTRDQEVYGRREM
jgi:hypothetical protein